INALYVFLITVAWGIFLAFTARPLFVYLINNSEAENGATQFNVFIVFMVMSISAFFTQAVGIDAIFGAFLVGLITPHDKGFAIAMTEKIEDLVLILFLPLYFAYSGLNTQLGTLDDAQTWGVIILITVTACGGKILGCTFASRMTGVPWRESWAIGFLMNTKGLVEIIVLNLGLQAKVISPKVFAMFLIMALVTTFMTVPIVSYIYPQSMYLKKPSLENLNDSSTTLTKQSGNDGRLKVLICLPSMKVVPAVMNLSQILFSSPKPLDVIALRLIELGQRMSKVMLAKESSHTLQSDPVINILRTFGQLNNKSIKTLMSVSPQSNFAADIIEAAETLETSLIIFPIEESVNTYPKGWAAATARQLWQEAPCPFAFLVDRGFGVSNFTSNEADANINPGENQSIFFPCYGSDDDIEAAQLLRYFAHASAINIVVLQLFIPTEKSPAEFALSALKAFSNVTIETATDNSTSTVVNRAGEFGKKDLILIGYSQYESTAGERIRQHLDTQSLSSFMIVHKPSFLPANNLEDLENGASLTQRKNQKEKEAGNMV
ncbi:K(+)/H(+) antiporter, partial [Terramyces sp. JEL0728]